ncbi:hypothetical protein [Ideonella sp.]|uniref:hypothetical protein n=2 Tax=Ideonella sp. TaxID=1929293 RepID=UPI002D7FF3D6|nr:hypothetical protein [Ideonella sp.]
MPITMSATMCAAGALLLGAAQAAEQPGQATTLTSTAKEMISFRHQKHSWITDDGRYQLLYNSGVNGNALQLSTSTDGVSWMPSVVLIDTDEASSADGSLNAGLLSVVYSTARHGISFAPLKYDPAKGWKIKGPGQVVRPGSENDDKTFKHKPAYLPSLVEDHAGNFWAVFLEQTLTKETKSTQTALAVLRLYYRPKDGSTWSDTGMTFGDSANPNRALNAPKLSGRLVRTPDSIGLVFADGADIWWAQLPKGSAWNDKWQASTLLIQGTPDSEADKDPYASHFSTATDDQGNIHLVYADAKIPYYRRFNASVEDGGPAWSMNSVAFSKEPMNTGYPEVSHLGGSNIAVVFNAQVPDPTTGNNKLSNLRVWQSATRGGPNGGQTGWVCTDVLTHAKAGENPSQYQHMRNEMPASVPATVQPLVLLQHQPTTSTYEARGYQFPVSGINGCKQQ